MQCEHIIPQIPIFPRGTCPTHVKGDRRGGGRIYGLLASRRRHVCLRPLRLREEVPERERSSIEYVNCSNKNMEVRQRKRERERERKWMVRMRRPRNMPGNMERKGEGKEQTTSMHIAYCAERARYIRIGKQWRKKPRRSFAFISSVVASGERGEKERFSLLTLASQKRATEEKLYEDLSEDLFSPPPPP